MLLSMIFIMTSFMMISSSYPMTLITSIIMATITGNLEMILNNNMVWVSMIVIMLFVGGLMIIYIFILSMNSNQSINMKSKLKMTISLTLLILMFSKNQTKPKINTGSLIFSMNWEMMIIIMMIIIMSMIMMSKLIFHPSTPSKSMK
uniref:NADH dehydrogenase subunit 6 n=1 Tax=Lebertia trifurcilla TaxID=450597 RepID=UPI00211549A7|nr:NADH dehydrogenase subunit 6 [Lebertia trifurcilla]UTE89515.1 NADH dehydrogenase subunit 6 [Lebertia trifurcilla]